MGATAGRSYPYPEASDSPQVHLDIKAGLEPVDADITQVFADWGTFTPTFTAVSGGASAGSTSVQTGRYRHLGHTVDFTFRFTLSGAGLSGGSGLWQWALPIQAALPYGVPVPIGLATAVKSGVYLMGTAFAVSSLLTQIVLHNTTGGISGSVPSSWTDGDEIRVTGRYQTAVSS